MWWCEQIELEQYYISNKFLISHLQLSKKKLFVCSLFVSIFLNFSSLVFLLQGDVYMYYSLNNFYQNHRRYVKSRDDYQLLGSDVPYSSLSVDCEPYRGIKNSSVSGDGIAYAPCGAIANSIFNGNNCWDFNWSLITIRSSALLSIFL